MPISKSAKKALRVARRKTSVNRHRKAVVKTALKAASKDTVAQAVSLVDKAAKLGIIHPNKAARVKSQLMKKHGTGTAKTTDKAAAKPKVTAKKSSKPATKPAKKTAPKAKK